MFYCLSSHPSNRYKYLIMDYDFYKINTYQCNTCGREVKYCQLEYWPPKMFLEGGKRYPDHLSVSIPFDDKCGLVISEKAFEIFEKENINGYTAESIEINDDKSNTEVSVEKPKYYYLYVNGSISLDYGAMHYKKKNYCPDCGTYNWSRQKIGESILDHSSWNQCDICKLVDYPNILICTQKVIDVIKKYNLKGFVKGAESDIFLPLKEEKVC